MDKDNILSLTNDLDSLEVDMTNWMQLLFDQRKRSNDLSIQKYGYTNEELYNILKGKALSHDNSINDNIDLESYIFYSKQYLNEAKLNINSDDAREKYNVGYTDNGLVNDNFDKIERSKNAMKQNDQFVIIPDFINPNIPDYTLDELESMYQKYLMIVQDYKQLSDNESYNIWGMSVPQMYEYMKVKILNHKDQDEKHFIPDRSDTELANYKQTVKESTDDLQKLIHKLDCKNDKNRTMYESYVLNKIGDSIQTNQFSYENDLPPITPFFTYDEYCKLNEHDDSIDAFRYGFGYNFSEDALHKMWSMHKNKELLEIGWNPYVEPTTENIKYARDKQAKYYDEHYMMHFYDISKFDTKKSLEELTEAEGNTETSDKIYPIFLVISNKKLKAKTKEFSKIYDILGIIDYSDIGISMTSSLTKIYRFVNHKGVAIMKTTAIDKYEFNESGYIILLFANSKIKNKIKTGLEEYYNNQNSATNYNFNNVSNITVDFKNAKKYYINEMIGSFLNVVLKIANVYNDTGSVMYAPKKKLKNASKMYVVYNNDILSKYKNTKVDKFVKYLQKNKDYAEMNYFDFYTPSKIDVSDYDYYSFDTYLQGYTNESVNSIVKEIRNCLTPTTIDESYIEGNYDSIKSQFDSAHELLSSYGESELEGMKKQVAKLIYLDNLSKFIVDRLKADHPDYNRLHILINSIEEDLNMYFKVIYQLEPNFDFKSYMSNSTDFEDVNINEKLYRYSSDNFKLLSKKI